MKKILLSSLAAAAVAVGTANAQLVTNNYAGNGNTSFGGAVGNGSLQIVNDNLGALNFTFTRGTSDFNNALVIYLATIPGGAASTSGFTDSADGLRRAISGFNGTERSTLNFGDGGSVDFAIALNNGFAGLWSLSNPANFPFITSANLLPAPATQTESSYSFSINVADIGLTASSGQSFQFFTSYISESAFRSAETFGAGYDNNPSAGWNNFDINNMNTFTTVPEPSTYALLTLGALALGGYAARRRARK
jgi:hypothetical protein